MQTKKKFKIGVITFHIALNYGAVLQAYALQTFLNAQGYESSLIDYFPETFKTERKIIDSKSLNGFIKSLAKYPKYRQKINSFDRFLSKCNLSKKYSNSLDLAKLNENFDAFISGSDQVWNQKWNFQDPTYYLTFAKPNKKCSYAASFGSSIDDTLFETEIKNHLSSFNRISVRENAAAVYLQSKLKNKDIETNVDPTLLLAKEEWNKLVSKKKEKPFILLYTLEDNEKLIALAKKEAKKRNLRIVQIRDVFKKEDPEISYASCISPQHFVSLFAKADFIITNSFHGLVFSIIFEKEFLVAKQTYKNAPNERLTSLLKELRLENRELENFIDAPIDYKLVKEQILKEKEKSISYFKKIESDRYKVFPRSFDKCSGCTACYAVCPTKAIEMREGELGFSYPVINLNRCIHCNLCYEVCMYINPKNTIENNLLRAYATKNKSEKERVASRSGGVFPLLAKQTISKSGVVYGATIDPKNLSVSHIKIENEKDIPLLTKSKYVESKLKDTFIEIAAELRKGRHVLFSGVPCQNAGLKYLLKTLKIDDSNLLCVDLICHGYMSPEIYRTYLARQRKQYVNISDFEFRDKSFGWDTHFESFLSNGAKISKTEYTSIFYTNSFLRPSCYGCLYTNLSRPGDITLGDGWGVKNILPDFDDNKGVSTILINSEKGNLAFDSIKGRTNSQEVEINKVMQHNLSTPTVPSKKDKRLKNIYGKKGYESLSKESSKLQDKLARKNKFKSSIVKILRKFRLK